MPALVCIPSILRSVSHAQNQVLITEQLWCDDEFLTLNSLLEQFGTVSFAGLAPATVWKSLGLPITVRLQGCFTRTSKSEEGVSDVMR
jgi:hypothetical protein